MPQIAARITSSTTPSGIGPATSGTFSTRTSRSPANLRQIESALDVSIARRGAAFTVRGQPAQTRQAAAALERFYAEAHAPLSIDDIQLGLVELRSVAEREATPQHGKTLRPRR